MHRACFVRGWMVLAALLLVGSGQARAQVALVLAGESRAELIVHRDTPAHVYDAARLIRRYIERVSGAALPIRDAPSLDEGVARVWVGPHPAIEAYLPGIDTGFERPEQILIAAREADLLIIGRDRQREGRQVEVGTLLAAQVFLHEHLGVRWLWPGALGTDVPSRRTIAFEPFTYRFAPPLRTRQIRAVNHERAWRLLGRPSVPGVPHIERVVKQMDRDVRAWLNRHGLDHAPPGERVSPIQGSLDFEARHYFQHWHERYFADHPDWFAMQPDGTRGTWPDEPRYRKLCISNPQVARQYVAEAVAYFTDHPDRRMISASPNDWGWDGYCVCADCRAWDAAGAALLERPLRWRRVERPHHALTDRYAHFWNTLSEQLREALPGREVAVGVWAYHATRPAPVEVELNDNIYVGYVGIWRRDPQANSRANVAEQLEKWRQWSTRTHHMIWRPNLIVASHGDPYIFTGAYGRVMGFLADHRIAGIDIDSFHNHWATQGPQYYLAARLAWNPHADADAVMDDYYRRAFGPAHAEMRAYFQIFEGLYAYLAEGYDDWNRARDMPGLYRNLRIGRGGKADLADFVTLTAEERASDRPIEMRAERLLREARQQVADASPVYARRVAFVAAGFEYLQSHLDVLAYTGGMRGRLTPARFQRGLQDAVERRKQVMRAQLDTFAIGFFQLHQVATVPARRLGPMPLELMESSAR